MQCTTYKHFFNTHWSIHKYVPTSKQFCCKHFLRLQTFLLPQYDLGISGNQMCSCLKRQRFFGGKDIFFLFCDFCAPKTSPSFGSNCSKLSCSLIAGQRRKDPGKYFSMFCSCSCAIYEKLNSIIPTQS